jgi:hypothetical protein
MPTTRAMMMNDSHLLYTGNASCAGGQRGYAEALMLERMKKSKYRKVFGGLLIFYGVVALIMPGIPGAWFIFIGLEFFGIRLVWGEKLKVRWRILRQRLFGEKTEPPVTP